VDADLVRAARFRPSADQCEPREPLNDFVFGNRRSGIRVVTPDRFLFPMRWMVPNRLVDDISIAVGHSGDDRQILFFDATRLELGGQCVVGLVILGNHNYTARVAIEPVNDAGPRRAAPRAKRTEMMGQRACQCSFPVTLCRVNDHAGRLVDNNDRFVFMQYGKRDVLRRGSLARRFELLDDDAAPGSQSQRRFAWQIIDRNVAGVDRAAQRGPAERLEVTGQKYIEPLACLLWGDDE
jgi:hypothetical protein